MTRKRTIVAVHTANTSAETALEPGKFVPIAHGQADEIADAKAMLHRTRLETLVHH